MRAINDSDRDEVMRLRISGVPIAELALRFGIKESTMRKTLQSWARGESLERRDRFCKRGHDKSVVGTYNGSSCIECRRIRNAEKAREAGGWQNLRKPTAHPNQRVPNATNAISPATVERMLRLRIAAETAPHWERERLIQEADSLAGGAS